LGKGNLPPAPLTAGRQPLQCMDVYTVSGVGPPPRLTAAAVDANLKKRYSMDDNKSKALAAALSQIEKQFIGSYGLKHQPQCTSSTQHLPLLNPLAHNPTLSLRLWNNT